MYKKPYMRLPKTGPSYMAWMSFTLIMILAFAFLAVCGYKLFESNDSYRRLSEINATVKSSLVNLAKQVDSLTIMINGIEDQSEDATVGDIPVFAIQAEDAVRTIDEKITSQASPLAESLSIMQGQYDQFTGYLNFLFIVLAALLTIFTVAIPFMNYNFLQKDQIIRLNRQYSELEDKMNVELTRMQKAIAQATQVSSEIAVSDKAGGKEIKPISDNPVDVAQAAYISSQLQFSRRNYLEALSRLDIAINLVPENAEYLFSRGVTLHEMKRYEEALRDKEAAVLLDPNNAAYLFDRGVTFHEMKQYEKALKDEDEAVRLDPYNARYLYGRSITLHSMKRYEEALKDENVTVRMDPNNASYLFNRGVTLHEMMRYEEALKDEDEAVRMDPNNALYLNNRGSTLHEMMRYEEALRDKEAAVRLDPNNAKYLFDRGVTLHEMMRYEEALKDANDSVRLDPNNAFYLYSRGVTLLDMKRYEEALKDVDEAVRMDPNNALYLYVRGITLCRMKRYEEALNDNEAAVRLDPNNAKYLFTRGVTLHNMKRYEEALIDKEAAVRLKPNDIIYLESHSATLHEMKLYEEALKDDDEAVRLKPNSAMHLNYRSITLHKLKRYKEALKDANLANKLVPDDAKYIGGVGVELYSLHQYDRAIEKFDAAIQKDDSISFIYRYHGLCIIQLIKLSSSSRSKVDALRDLDKAIEIEGDYSFNYLARAEYYIWQKEYNRALDDLNKALSLDENEPEVYQMFAVYYQSLGDTANAEKYHKLADEHGYIPEPQEE